MLEQLLFSLFTKPFGEIISAFGVQFHQYTDDILEQNFEHLLAINADDAFVLTGDLNHMDTSRFESILGFVQIIIIPTHENNITEKFITNRPDLFSVQVMQSLAKTKHKAVLVNCDKPADNMRSVQPRHTVEVRLYSPNCSQSAVSISVLLQLERNH